MKKGDIVIDVYSIEALEMLLERLEAKRVEPVKASVNVQNELVEEPGEGPDFVAGNPWLKIISQKQQAGGGSKS